MPKDKPAREVDRQHARRERAQKAFALTQSSMAAGHVPWHSKALAHQRRLRIAAGVARRQGKYCCGSSLLPGHGIKLTVAFALCQRLGPGLPGCCLPARIMQAAAGSACRAPVQPVPAGMASAIVLAGHLHSPSTCADGPKPGWSIAGFMPDTWFISRLFRPANTCAFGRIPGGAMHKCVAQEGRAGVLRWPGVMITEYGSGCRAGSSAVSGCT